MPFEDIQVKISDVTLQHSGAVTFNHLVVRGVIPSERTGRFDIDFKQAKERSRAHVDLKDIDMSIVRPIYEDSLPVSFSEGYLTLESKSRIEKEFLDSKNHLVLDAYQMTPSRTGILGNALTKAIVQALNKREKFELSFRITGDPEKPSFEGFQEPLMEMIKEDLAEGVSTSLTDKAKEQAGKLGEKLKDLF